VVQLFTGLQDLHAINILHRDIKPENMLLTADGTLRIADFGWATDTSRAASSMAGTFHYMAPEVLEGKRVHTEAVDVWSSGASLFEILSGHLVIAPPPETGHAATDQHRGDQLRRERLLADISSKCPLPADHRFPFLSENCWALLTQALMPNAERRITVFDALQSSWLQPSLPQRPQNSPTQMPTMVPRRASGERLASSPSLTVLTVKPVPFCTRRVGRDSPLSTSRSEASTRLPSRSDSGTPPMPQTQPSHTLPPAGLNVQLAAARQRSCTSLLDPSVVGPEVVVRRQSLKVPVGTQCHFQVPFMARRSLPCQSPRVGVVATSFRWC